MFQYPIFNFVALIMQIVLILKWISCLFDLLRGILYFQTVKEN